MIQLKDIPRGSTVKAQLKHQDGVLKDRLITYHHLDGMYSYCTILGSHMEEVVHLSALTWLEKIGDCYVIKEQST